MSSTGASAESSVRIICGPTGAGKSAIAMRLAEAHNAVIISADSRQVYRCFDIGTAKPTAAERDRVPHRGVDVADASERYSAARWAESARAWIAQARAVGREALIVGGTGFYLRALVDPLFESPELDPVRRAALERSFKRIDTEELRRWCVNLDPDRSHLGRTQLIRSLETAMLTGHTLTELHRTRARAPTMEARYLVVDPGPSLATRIERRFDEMLASGWAQEVDALIQSVDESAPAWKASGYGVMREMIAGRLSAEVARERVIIETRQYAKRQRTWFRHQIDAALATRIDPNDPAAEAYVNDWWDGRGIA
ncbi:MAG TPA: tRNA (adenosine(37)-N6)-dimethylallyltransferase MiaA [Gemmatimonadaceae bacterium]|nr:tRNA (adenosine(37)-N6)-dimethylallyltransferase MiaA [Gemmatimonadaceae bacterium]